jgi:hypothetical protein
VRVVLEPPASPHGEPENMPALSLFARSSARHGGRVVRFVRLWAFHGFKRIPERPMISRVNRRSGKHADAPRAMLLADVKIRTVSDDLLS